MKKPVLSVNWSHQGAACIVKDGKVLMAITEERLNRIKFKTCYYYDAEGRIRARYPMAKSVYYLLSSFPDVLDRKIWECFSEYAFNVNEENFTFNLKVPSHHLAHALSAFYPSGYERAAVLTCDAHGVHGFKEETAAFFYIDREKIVQLKSILVPDSLGKFYEKIAEYLGLGPNPEGKMMGLSSYGTDEYLGEFRKIVYPVENGEFRLNQEYIVYPLRNFAGEVKDAFLTEKFYKKFGYPGCCGKNPLHPHYCNIAFAAQRVLEEILLHMARYLKALTKEENLCLAGGVALNCLANTRILKESGFKNVFIQPAADDAGLSLGYAYFIEKIIRKAYDFDPNLAAAMENINSLKKSESEIRKRYEVAYLFDKKNQCLLLSLASRNSKENKKSNILKKLINNFQAESRFAAFKLLSYIKDDKNRLREFLNVILKTESPENIELAFKFVFNISRELILSSEKYVKHFLKVLNKETAFYYFFYAHFCIYKKDYLNASINIKKAIAIAPNFQEAYMVLFELPEEYHTGFYLISYIRLLKRKSEKIPEFILKKWRVLPAFDKKRSRNVYENKIRFYRRFVRHLKAKVDYLLGKSEDIEAGFKTLNILNELSDFPEIYKKYAEFDLYYIISHSYFKRKLDLKKIRNELERLLLKFETLYLKLKEFELSDYPIFLKFIKLSDSLVSKIVEIRQIGFLNIADWYLERGKVEKALLFAKWPLYFVQKPEALCMAGHCFKKKHELLKAKEFFKKAYEINNRFAEALSGLIDCYIYENIELAIKLAEKFVSLKSDFFSHLTLAQCYLKAGRKGLAESIVNKLEREKICSDYTEFTIKELQKLAEVYFEIGCYNKALSVYKILDKKHVNVKSEIVRCYLKIYRNNFEHIFDFIYKTATEIHSEKTDNVFYRKLELIDMLYQILDLDAGNEFMKKELKRWTDLLNTEVTNIGEIIIYLGNEIFEYANRIDFDLNILNKYMGFAYLSNNAYILAARYFEEYLYKQKDALAFAGYGFALKMKKDFKNAFSAFLKSIALNENSLAWLGLAQIYERLDDLDKAGKIYEQLLRTDSKPELLISYARVLVKLDCFEKALLILNRKFPQKYKVSVLEEKGFLFYKKGDVSTSISCLEQALKLKSASYWACFVLALIYKDKHEPLKALKVLQNLTRESVGTYEILKLKGECYLEILDYDLAIDYFKKALSLRYSLSVVKFIALCYMLKRDYLKAEEILKEDANVLNNAEALTALASVKHKLGKIKEALALFDKAVLLDEFNSLAYSGKGFVYLDIDKEMAKKNFLRALYYNISNPWAKLGLGIYYYYTDRFEQSISILKRSLLSNDKRIKAEAKKFYLKNLKAKGDFYMLSNVENDSVSLV